MDYIHKNLSDLDEGFTQEQLHYALKKGKMVLFFDGFDEIDFIEKDNYERQILEISNKYQDSILVVSSRPDDSLSAWEEFYIYKAKSLNKEQSIDLISRIEYNEIVKEKFISELSEGLYQKHSDFLSNPLLLTMMLLTYEQLAEIPEKVHIFYEQAFDTLFHKHDALKSLYKRKSYTRLAIDDFKKIFSAFCILSFSERKISFTYEELTSLLKKAIEIEGFNVDPEKFFNDLIKSVCIIQKDGNVYTFSHRSFQEYFAALFISNSETVDTKKILDKMSNSSFQDNIISMIFELNKELIEIKWIIPRLKVILEKINFPKDNKEVVKLMSFFYSEISNHGTSRLGLTIKNKKGEISYGHFSQWLHRLYRKESDNYFPINKGKYSNEVNLYYKNTTLGKENFNTLNFNDFPDDLDWLSNTTLPKHAIARFNLYTEIFEKLQKKYSERENSLSSLLY